MGLDACAELLLTNTNVVKNNETHTAVLFHFITKHTTCTDFLRNQAQCIIDKTDNIGIM